VPLAASLLFVAHPLHTESVTYIVQRFTSMVGFFVLSSALLHFMSLTARNRIAGMALRGFAVLATIAGMLTKESMFTAPLLIVMLHVVLMDGTFKRACWQALPHLLCMLIIPVLALMTSHAQSGSGSIAGAMQIAASSKDPAYQFHYFLTQLGVILEYVRLLVWPTDMNVDRQYQLATSPLQLRVWLSGLVILGILGAAWRHYRAYKGDIRHALICAGAFWYFLRLMVSSSFVPLDDLMVDHRTYGASMGLFTVLACVFDLIRTEWPLASGSRWTAPAALAAWVALLGTTTLDRNDVWQSETKLWSDAVLKSPNKARPWDNLGVCHFMAGRQDEAIACLVKSASLNPQHLPAYMKLGVIYNSKAKFGDAVGWSRKGLTIFPDSAPLHYNLGVALCGLGKIPDGLTAMLNAVKFMPTHTAAHAALGQI
jgi:tetratricopeptide (TPR) repeat protein